MSDGVVPSVGLSPISGRTTLKALRERGLSSGAGGTHRGSTPRDQGRGRRGRNDKTSVTGEGHCEARGGLTFRGRTTGEADRVRFRDYFWG